jgi:hypothetical protein
MQAAQTELPEPQDVLDPSVGRPGDPLAFLVGSFAPSVCNLAAMAAVCGFLAGSKCN